MVKNLVKMGIVGARETTGDGIKIGSKVTVELDGSRHLSLVIGGQNQGNLSLVIGGQNQGNLDLGIISCEAPLAKAVLGKLCGESAEYTAGGQIHTVKIVRISQ